jgi:hypothetical protein
MQAGEDHAEEVKAMQVPTVCIVFSVPLATYLLFGSVTTSSQE